MVAGERALTESDEEIDYIGLGQIAWSYKVTIVAITVFCGLVATYLAVTATPIYRSEVVVTEVHDRSMSGGAESLASQLGGIASLTGLSLPGGDKSSLEAQAILQSRHLIEVFITRYNLLPEIFVEPNAKHATLWSAVERFKQDVLTIRGDARKGLTTISIDWTDPAVAARWANEYVALANELIRTRAINDSTRNIAYLNEQVSRTSVVEIQHVMYNLIENETKTLMLANSRAEYAFSIVDPAVPPERRLSPKRTVIILIGIVLGLTVGVVVALTRNKLHRRRRMEA